MADLTHICIAAILGVMFDFRYWVVLTSWMHYCKYISQYYWRTARTEEKYSAWKRDVLLFKTLALCNLAYIYIMGYVKADFQGFPDYISLAMICIGYYISIAATAALGVDGTYFGIELGFVKADYCFVTKFPYNFIPHPMILGQVFALVGVCKPPHVHKQWPWLIPVHIGLYLAHMIQEIYDFHDGIPWYKKLENETVKKGAIRKRKGNK